MGLFNDKAQAATELAVFGAILIFVVGGIIRSGVQSGMEQNQSLKAMRWALNQSFRGARSGNKSRDAANLLVIEDRLSPDPGKFGSLERMPTIQFGSGTFTNNLMMPMDWEERQNVPVMDVFVNNQHFTFTGGRFVFYDVQLVLPGDPFDSDPKFQNKIRVWDLTNGVKQFYPRVDYGNWMPNCLATTTPGVMIGCPIFFTITPANSVNFCSDEATCDNTVANFEQRFDLNMNFIYKDDPQGAQRNNIMWQWSPIRGLVESFDIDSKNGKYPTTDIDYDRKEEAIYGVNGPLPVGMTESATPPPGTVRVPPINYSEVAQRFAVYDTQKGDINSSLDDTDRYNAPPGVNMNMGIQKDVSIYTVTGGGTYLEIREGKAYVPDTGRFVRSATRRDQIDVVSRMLQLSNDTGRYCPNAGAPGSPGAEPPPTIADTTLPNPVKACVNSELGLGNCFMPGTVNVTCFDKGTNMIFIRSQIHEQRGRKWVTQIE
jgi:hypothetical protein